MPRQQTQEVGGLCCEAFADFNANNDEPAAAGALEPRVVLAAGLARYLSLVACRRSQ